VSGSSSSKYDESWSSTVKSFHESPIKMLSPIESKQKEHSIEDYMESQGTLSKYVHFIGDFLQASKTINHNMNKTSFWTDKQINFINGSK